MRLPTIESRTRAYLSNYLYCEFNLCEKELPDDQLWPQLGLQGFLCVKETS